MPSERQARIDVIRIRNDCFETTQNTLCEYCRNEYEKYIRNVLECMDTDFMKFQLMIPSYLKPQNVMEDREAWERFGKTIRSMSAERIREITGLADENKYRYNAADIITYIFLNHYFGSDNNAKDSGWYEELQSLLTMQEEIDSLPFEDIQNKKDLVKSVCRIIEDTVIVKY